MAQGSLITKEMRQAIGRWRLSEFPPEVVDIWGIRRYVAATQDPNPLWRDEEYAKKMGWGGIIAPPSFVEVFNPGYRWMRECVGDPEPFPFKLPFERQLMSGESYEFFIPIRPGDAIVSRGTLGEISEKQSGSAGRLLFIPRVIEYCNQRGELVARTKWITMSLETPPQRTATPQPPAPERAVGPARFNPQQVYFEDVEVGTEILSMEKRVTMTTIAKWAGATGDVGAPHFEFEYMTKEFGMPSVIAQGPMNSSFLAQLITNWIGGWGVLKQHSAQFRGSVFPKDIITFCGRVSNKYVKQGEHFVECETWAENQHGNRVTLGKSVVTLPARGG